jgi:hypothetical protein
MPYKLFGAPDAQHLFREIVGLIEHSFRVFYQAEDLLRNLVQELSGWRQFQLLLSPNEELHAVAIFQRPYLKTDRRLGNEELLSRAGDASAARSIVEGLQLVQVKVGGHDNTKE